MTPQASVTPAGEAGIMQLSGGVWAGQQFANAMRSGEPMDSSVLRTNNTLQEFEWQHLDEAVVEEAMRRLGAIQDLLDAGLTVSISNALGLTEYKYERVSDLQDAEVSMSGVARSVLDRQDYTPIVVPMPLVHKDFNLFRRHLEASRNRGESIDTTQIRNATRRVLEKLEDLLFNGGPAFGGNALPGYLTHTNRNTASFGTNGAWSAGAKTGENILDDVLTLRAALRADRYFGPYWLYVPKDFESKLLGDFKANSDKSIIQRIREVDDIAAVRFVDQLTDSNVVMVQATSDVVQLADGQAPTPVEWELSGAFQINFKVWALQVPIIKADSAGRSGIAHMS